MKYQIEETREIIKGYVTETWFIEASSEEEALQMIEDCEVDSEDYDVEVHNTEFLERTIDVLSDDKIIPSNNNAENSIPVSEM